MSNVRELSGWDSCWRLMRTWMWERWSLFIFFRQQESMFCISKRERLCGGFPSTFAPVVDGGDEAR